MTPEKKVQNSIIDYLHMLHDKGKPVFVERRQAGGFAYKMGIADLYAVVDGKHIEIEVKRPGGSLRPMQEKWRDRCKAMNILWLCAESKEDVKNFIEEHFENFL